MKTNLTMIGGLVISLLMGADSPKEWDEMTVRVDGLQGSWELISLEINGTRMKAGDGRILTFRGTQFTYTSGARAGGYEVTFRQRPFHLEIALISDEVKSTIYQVDGEMLWIAYRTNGVTHPTGFDEKDVLIWTYKRVKK